MWQGMWQGQSLAGTLGGKLKAWELVKGVKDGLLHSDGSVRGGPLSSGGPGWLTVDVGTRQRGATRARGREVEGPSNAGARCGV